MFENVLGQPAAVQLASDIRTGLLAPSMLFSGPAGSGKGTAALELGRILSCENRDSPGVWNCPCPACARHRLLTHPDLLVLGPRSFSSEAAAAASVFLREPGAPQGQLLLIRSVRKLLIRFAPSLWEEDAKIGKLSPLIAALDEDLDEILRLHTGEAPLETGPRQRELLGKICDSILKNVRTLEAEGPGELVPVAHVRRAAYWSRLAPLGRRKLLLIENADRMQEGARNALLKILEEPPESVHILLCSPRREALIPTILSRLRPYRFYQREPAVEEDLIRRVFREPAPVNRGTSASPLAAYFDSFLPVPMERLYPLAAFFAASLALQTLRLLGRRGPAGGGAGSKAAVPAELAALGKHSAPLAEAAGFGRPLGDTRLCLAKVLEEAGQFEASGLFARFLRLLLTLVSESLREEGSSPSGAGYADLWRRLTGEAAAAVGTYNQSPGLALERLGADFRRAAAAYYAGPVLSPK
jgi:DNA polymerase-3 subunit gamma/tau